MTSNLKFRGNPRFLTLRHNDAVRAENLAANGEPGVDDSLLPPAGVDKPDKGHEQLFSYFAPALAGGDYKVTTVQTVNADGQPLSRTTTKAFSVEAPRYVLPDGAVHSVYPPNGTESPAETLPHILFTDPYLPWERLTEDEGDKRQRAPCLALIAFSEEELVLDKTILDPTNGILQKTGLAAEARQSQKQIQQSPTLALNLAIADLPKIIDTKTTIPSTQDTSIRGDVILIKPRLFQLLTTEYLPGGTPNPQQTTTDIKRYKYLAHVRYSNAHGMEATGDDGLYSAVFSHRTGPLHSDRSSRTIVHLVSLEGWINQSLDIWKSPFIVCSSLFSWSYTVLSTGAKSVAERFIDLGKGLNILKMPDASLDKLTSSRIKSRIQEGYTLTKYVTQTGEETAAIIRGPLTPVKPPDKLSTTWESLSFSGSNLEIFDTQLGLMDITYSTAWTLGKTLALADQVFTTSLARLRTMCDAYALEKSKSDKLAKMNAWTPRANVVSGLTEMVTALSNIANGNAGKPDPSRNLESMRAFDESAADISRSDPEIHAGFEDAAANKMMALAASEDDPVSKFFNELNKPSSTDWMIILAWIIDKLYLFNIPAHYLLPNPSVLPVESLRFFYIDPHWTDAFVDGALSLANHISRTDDVLRRCMKQAKNAYFEAIDPSLGYRPQLPTYGCLLRSDLVRSFPDMHITAPFPKTDGAAGGNSGKRAPVLRHERLAEDTLLCLFDRKPGSKELAILTFTQPAHQQYFVTGKKITPDNLEIVYKQAHTQAPKPGEKAYLPYKEVILPSKIDLQNPVKNRIFIWGEDNETRFLNLEALGNDILDTLGKDPTRPFTDNISTSALISYELGCPVYQLNLLAEGVSLLDELPDDDDGPRLFRMLKPQGPNPDSQMLHAPTMTATPSPNKGGVAKLKIANLASSAASNHPAIISSSFVLDIPRLTKTSTRTLAASAITSDRGPPTFQWLVYPIEAYNKVIPTNSGYPIDLIFSIKILDAKGRGENLTMIRLEIPFGEVGKLVNGTKPLLASYDGPGPVMLSNLRWNVIMSQRELDRYYDLTLLPRSIRGKTPTVPVKKAADCSFLLPMVKVNKYTDTAYVTIRHTVSYVEYNDQFATTDIILQPVKPS